MSPDIEDLLRNELRGAASGAPHDLGVDGREVLHRGHRVLVRRRVLTTAGVVAAGLAVAGTIGVLAPGLGDTDTLPALPSATATPTPEVTPTAVPSAAVTPSPSPSVTITTTPSPTTTVSDEPSATSDPTPSTTRPGPSPTPSSTMPPWSATITVAGKEHRGRLEPVIDSMGEKNYDLVVQTDGREAWRWRAMYPSDGIHGIDRTDPRRYMQFTRTRYVDLVSIDGEPVTEERIGHLRLVSPADVNTGSVEERTFYVAIFRVPTPVGETGAYGPAGWVVEMADGYTGPMDE